MQNNLKLGFVDASFADAELVRDVQRAGKDVCNAIGCAGEPFAHLGLHVGKECSHERFLGAARERGDGAGDSIQIKIELLDGRDDDRGELGIIHHPVVSIIDRLGHRMRIDLVELLGEDSGVESIVGVIFPGEVMDLDLVQDIERRSSLFINQILEPLVGSSVVSGSRRTESDRADGCAIAILKSDQGRRSGGGVIVETGFD